uniref:Solute carrier family 15 member 1 n=1 Tax=Anser cygnoides TaxID=8845 RepID=A0A8B9EQG2_ANSCY
MRAVLVLYFKYFLRWDDNFSTAIYHTFVALCYLTPILGALIADSWLGKFKTIVSLSIVYTVGALSMTGLILIALGTGGIKPCVSAFGGDQFEDHQEKQRSRFFSIFYLAINAGSLLSTVITPILRGNKQQCYPLAFGVPAALMAVSLIVFMIGSGMYKKVQPQGNIMVQVCKCIGFAIKNRFRHRSKEYPKREHWLDWASEKYSKRLITQTRMVLKVLFLYIPLPMFWALFDQQGSRWTLQATTMDGNFGAIQIQPDQMQTVNPILIVIMVPVVDAVIYPLIRKCKINFTPLRKMTVGMFLAGLAFIAAALVQLQIDVSSALYSLLLFLMYHFNFQCSGNVAALNYSQDIPPNTVHMAWQIPQYFIMTCGEVVFSVTGLEFSYSQAPSNMKSVLQAGWLLTVAVGNIIVLIVAGASKLSQQWAEYVLFAALLFAVCIIFSVMAYFYTYIDPNEIEGARMVFHISSVTKKIRLN